MAKFCVLANKITNCTDNCKRCLEEEAKQNETNLKEELKNESSR